MKKIHYLLTGALAAIFSTASLSAATITQVGANSFGESWLTGADWSDGNPASAGNDYVNTGFLLRTPTAGSGPFVFAGDSLTINGGGELLVRDENAFAVVQIGNLTLDSAVVNVFSGQKNLVATTVTIGAGGARFSTATSNTFVFDTNSTVQGAGNIGQGGNGNALLWFNTLNASTYTGTIVAGNALGNTSDGSTRLQFRDGFSSGGGLVLARADTNDPTRLIFDADITFTSLQIDGVNFGNGTYNFTDLTAQVSADFFIGNTGTITVVPEPSTFALLSGALALLAIARRRRRA